MYSLKMNEARFRNSLIKLMVLVVQKGREQGIGDVIIIPIFSNINVMLFYKSAKHTCI